MQSTNCRFMFSIYKITQHPFDLSLSLLLARSLSFFSFTRATFFLLLPLHSPPPSSSSHVDMSLYASWDDTLIYKMKRQMHTQKNILNVYKPDMHTLTHTHTHREPSEMIRKFMVKLVILLAATASSEREKNVVHGNQHVVKMCCAGWKCTMQNYTRETTHKHSFTLLISANVVYNKREVTAPFIY